MGARSGGRSLAHTCGGRRAEACPNSNKDLSSATATHADWWAGRGGAGDVCQRDANQERGDSILSGKPGRQLATGSSTSR
eukprot:COSAG06_NODE_23680_length_684_cov_1.211966_1_plen_80_part_00